jgi:hypothetical protein
MSESEVASVPEAVDALRYFERLIALHVEFDVAIRALDSFEASPSALDEYGRRAWAESREATESAAKLLGWDAGLARFDDPSETQRALAKEKERALSQLPVLKKRMRQNLYVLMVAVFEGCMKEIHRAALNASPELIESNRPITVSEVLAKGIDAVRAEAVERAVHRLDRLSAEEQAEHFRKHLTLPYDENTAGHVGHVVGVRNALLHGDVERDISDAEMALMRGVTLGVPIRLIGEAAKRFPKHFAAFSFHADRSS